MENWHLGMCADNLDVSTLSEIPDIVKKTYKKQFNYNNRYDYDNKNKKL